MKLKQFAGFCLLALFALASCKKGSNPNPAAKLDTGVYAIGSLVGGPNSGPVVWKNGVATRPDSTSVYNLVAIAINGNDLYTVGWIYTPLVGTAAYWKNGILTKLTDGSADAEAYDIDVSGNNVYVAGYVSTGTAAQNTITSLAAYWKNGVLTTLANAGPSYAYKIMVSGTDVYALGYINKNKPLAVYWKNGVVNLIGDTSQTVSIGGIAVQNNNLYIAYTQSVPNSNTTTAYLSKNGVATPLANTFNSSQANGLLISGNDIYVAGGVFNVSEPQMTAVYWKNNTLYTLPPIPGSNLVANRTYNIAVSGNDVYVAGQSQGAAVYWKNSVAVKLANSISVANGIAIVH